MLPPADSVAAYLPLTPDPRAERLTELRRLFPDLFSDEGHPNPDALADLLRPAADAPTTPERYAFTWSGKRAAHREAFTPTTATLVPDAARSVNPERGRHAIIEGENLEVLKLLRAGYHQRVKCIYIDPPYNTGNDFVYPDNYSVRRHRYWEETGGVENGVKVDTNPDTAGRYHSAWLSMMYERLLVARQLLRNDGVILVSISDEEVHNLRKVLDEVFGDRNFIATLVWEKGRKNDAKLFSKGHEYIHVYARDLEYLKGLKTVWREEKKGAREIWTEYLRLRDLHGEDFGKIEEDLRAFYDGLDRNHPAKRHSRYNKVDARGVWRDADMSWPGGDGPTYDVIHPVTLRPCAVPSRGWCFATPEKMQEQIDEGNVIFRADDSEPPIRKKYLVRSEEMATDDEPEADADELEEADDDTADIGIQVAGTYFYRSGMQAGRKLRDIFGKKVFENPKDDEVLQRLIRYVCGKETDSIILDFFGGSGTTFQAVAELNADDGGARQCILVQLPEQTKASSTAYKEGYHKISDLTIARCRRVVEGYGATPRPLPTGFRVWRLEASQFPAAGFAPDPAADEATNLSALRAFLEAKNTGLALDFNESATQARIAEMLLKNSFTLNYQLTGPLPEYTHNTVYHVRDLETAREAHICPDPTLTPQTVEQLTHQPPAGWFIAAERAFDTTAKWNLLHRLEGNLRAT